MEGSWLAASPPSIPGPSDAREPASQPFSDVSGRGRSYERGRTAAQTYGSGFQALSDTEREQKASVQHLIHPWN